METVPGETGPTETIPQRRPMCAYDGVIQKVLAILVTLGFFGVILFMLTEPLPNTSHEVLLVMLGSLGTGWAMVMNYYFGSSSGSAAKTALAANRV